MRKPKKCKICNKKLGIVCVANKFCSFDCKAKQLKINLDAKKYY